MEKAELNSNFIHLHTHSHYSLLDGLSKIPDMVKTAKKNGMNAIAVTDHGNMYGAIELYKECQKAGIKAIIGVEAYIAERGRKDKEPGVDNKRKHLTLLAKNKQGYKNLMRLVTLANLEGYYYKPRMDQELLSKYSKGIIATTGCPGGEIQTRLRMGAYKEAVNAAAKMREIFGTDNYFLEIMDHSIDIEKRVLTDLLKLGKELNLPLLATNDLHYTHHKDAAAHEVMLCIQSGATLADPKRFKFESDGQSAKRIEIGRIRNTTGIIMESSAFEAAERTRLR